jgi:tRNA(Ile)-lysidine synthase
MRKAENFLDRFDLNIRQKRLIGYRDRVMVGFSGGPDSTGLLLALIHLRSKYKLKLLAVHINYHLRGDDNARELVFIKEFCFSHNISLLIKDYEPGAEKLNEVNLREFRRNLFSSLMEIYRFNVIALGHNQSDQAETILFRLLRGSVLTGLAGIRPRSGYTIHPLLPFSRDEITDFLVSEGVCWCEDRSNQENIFTRNKLRNIAFPWIASNINPQAVAKISEAAPFLLQADEILKTTALKKMRQITVDNNEQKYHLKIEGLLRIRPLLRFYIYRHIFGELSGSEQDFYQVHFELIEKSLFTQGNRSIQLPDNVCLLKEYDYLKFLSAEKYDREEVEAEREIPSLRNLFTYSGWRISMKKIKKLPEDRETFLSSDTAYIDYEKLKWPLVVRHRHPGDRFMPFGMSHHKKLKDFFIDHKIPAHERADTLIFTDQDKIIWIAGHRLDQRVAVNEETGSILMLKIEKIRHQKSRAAERIKKKKR